MEELVKVDVLRRNGKDEVSIKENLQHRAPLGTFIRVNNNVLNEFIRCAGRNVIVFTWIRDKEKDVYMNVGGKRFLNFDMDEMILALLTGIELDWISCSCSFK